MVHFEQEPKLRSTSITTSTSMTSTTSMTSSSASIAACDSCAVQRASKESEDLWTTHFHLSDACGRLLANRRCPGLTSSSTSVSQTTSPSENLSFDSLGGDSSCRVHTQGFSRFWQDSQIGSCLKVAQEEDPHFTSLHINEFLNVFDF